MTYPAVLGCNVAGIVAAVGSSVSTFSVGDKVVSDTPAYVVKQPKYGAWQRYVTSKARTSCRVGPDQNLEQAIAIPFGLLTAVAALSLTLGMERPPQQGEGKVLIWGAGGSVGGYAVQYATRVSLAGRECGRKANEARLTSHRSAIP